MRDFPAFAQHLATNINGMAGKAAFKVQVPNIFEMYLAAFPEGSNPIFRTNTEHDGAYDKNFIRNFGNVVVFDNDGSRLTIWNGWDKLEEPYRTVAKAMCALILDMPIHRHFLTTSTAFGSAPTPDNHSDIIWSHFHAPVPALWRDSDARKTAGLRDSRVISYRKALTEISLEAITKVLGLIETGLYRGDQYKNTVLLLKRRKEDFEAAFHSDDFVWANSSDSCATIRNTAIGTLLRELSDNTPQADAVARYRTMVSASNYMRSTGSTSQTMIDRAIETVDVLGLRGALNRRMASINDISVNNIIWGSQAGRAAMKDPLSDILKPTRAIAPASIVTGVQMGIEDFLSSVIPHAEKVEIQVTSEISHRAMALTTSDDPAQLFAWDNPFAWSYKGGNADSIRERVKRAGGNVDAPFRVSLSWSNSTDLDLHCSGGPEGLIYYNNSQGILDVDTNGIGAHNSIDPVENMSWKRYWDGTRGFWVHNFSSERNADFTIEVFFNGKSRFYKHPVLSTRSKSAVFTVDINNNKAEILFAQGSRFTEISDPNTSADGLTFGQFATLNAITLSPNYWDGSTGLKHYLFFVDGMELVGPAKGFFNEFLRPELREHRKVFEQLAGRMDCPPTIDGLVGYGFTKTDEKTIVNFRVTVDGKTTPYAVAI